MEFSEILKRRRSIRRFRQEEIPLETLKELVEAAALAPSAANAQCLRYVLVREKELLRAVLEQTAWGGHVKPYRNPEFGVTGPTAFLAVCTDLRADGKPSPYAETDAGAAIQSVLFRATDLGLGGCWIGLLLYGICKSAVFLTVAATLCGVLVIMFIAFICANVWFERHG